MTLIPSQARNSSSSNYARVARRLVHHSPHQIDRSQTALAHAFGARRAGESRRLSRDIRLRSLPKLFAWISSLLVCRQSAPADKRLPLAGSRVAHLLFERCEPVAHHHQSFVLCLDFIFLRFDLRLLLLDL